MLKQVIKTTCNKVSNTVVIKRQMLSTMIGIRNIHSVHHHQHNCSCCNGKSNMMKMQQEVSRKFSHSLVNREVYEMNNNPNSTNEEYEVSEEEKRQKSEKMGMFYTCKPCKQRHYVEFSKHSYHKGVVITRCKNCQQLHLIADNLGWIGDKKNLDEIYGKVVKQSDLMNKEKKE